MHPPVIRNAQLTYNVRRRFISNASFASGISSANLLDGICVATTTTVGKQLFQAVRVKSVEAWCTTVGGVIGPITVSVEFSQPNGAANYLATGDQLLHTDTSLGLEPAHVKCRPSSKSLASFFQASNSDVLFTITCPASTVVDLELEYVGSAGTAPVALGSALVAATAGCYYFRGMDGAATAATVWPPALPAVMLQ